MYFVPPDDGQKLTETCVGKAIYYCYNFDSEDAVRWLIFSEFKMYVERHMKLYKCVQSSPRRSSGTDGQTQRNTKLLRTLLRHVLEKVCN